MNKFKIAFNAGVEYNDKLYISAKDINGLFEYDLKEKTARYICNFSKESGFHALHCTAMLIGQEAWFMPEFGEYIAVVNLNTFDITYIKVPYQECNSECGDNIKYYSGGVFKDKYIFCVPTAVDTLAVIDIDTKDVEEYYIENKLESYFLYGYYYQGKISLISDNSDRALEVNLENHSIIEKKHPYETQFFKGIVFDDEEKKVWYAPGKADYIQCEDIISGSIEKIEIDRGNIDDGIMTNRVASYDDSLFFCGWDSDVIIRLFKSDNSIKYYKLNRNQKYKYRPLASMNYIILIEDGNTVFILNKVTDEFEHFDMEIETDLLSEQLAGLDLKPENLYGDSIYKECFYGLDYFMKKCIAKERSINSFEGMSGKRIWRSIS